VSKDRLIRQAAAKVRAKEGKTDTPVHPVRRFIDKAKDRIQATPEERLRRLEICAGCEWARVGVWRGEDYAKCGACGCPLSTRTKYKGVHCPKGKW
jgi:hypothetical protein